MHDQINMDEVLIHFDNLCTNNSNVREMNTENEEIVEEDANPVNLIFEQYYDNYPVMVPIEHHFIGNNNATIMHELFERILHGILTMPTEQNDVPLPLSENAMNQLQELKYSEYSTENKDKICSICQDEYKGDDIIKILPCKHFFHTQCITEWLTNYHYKCPICRQPCGEHVANV